MALAGSPQPGNPDPELIAALRALEVGVVTTVAGATLADLARLAASSDQTPLVVAADELHLAMPALLDLLDRPGDKTAALVADPRDREAPVQQWTALDRATLLRIGGDNAAIESVGTARRRVSNPNRISVGLLRIAGRDRARAAELWAAAARGGELDEVDAFDAALLTLVRGGVLIAASPLGYFSWTRGPVSGSGVAGSPWQQRLRTASRGGDGFYSTYVVRPLSRRLTALGLTVNASPNVLTAISLAIGLGTAGLIWLDRPWAWILAAFTLQLALIVDCMDGEIARFTRTFSSFGAWLDGVGDRVKEYAVFAALAIVAVRGGHASGWLLAIIAMVLVTTRHLEDRSYLDRLAPGRASSPELLPISARRDRNPEPARTALAPELSRKARTIFWIKKVIHVPIAERYLILSLGLLTMRPLWALWAAIAFSGFALAWTVSGRLLRAINELIRRSRDAVGISEALDDQLDLGPMARLAGQLGRISYLPGFVASIGLWLGSIAAICLAERSSFWVWIAVGAAALAALTAGLSCKPPLRHRLAWLSLPIVWCAEAAVAAALLAYGPYGAYVFVFLSAIAYRRYDLIYSLKLVDRPLQPVLTALGLGATGRILGVAVLAAIGSALGEVDSVLRIGLLGGSAYLLAVFAAETIRQWSGVGAQKGND